MISTKPMPLPAAVRRLESKTPVATRLNTAQLQQVELGVLDRAFFSARVEDIRIVAAMQARIADALSLTRRDGGAFMSRDKFINDMRAFLGAAPGDSGDLTDITSSKRLGLIYDMNVEEAREYGRWLAGQDPVLLAAYPCRELVRVESRVVPRGWRKGPGGLIAMPEESWPARWQANGGRFFAGRMIARVDDPIWSAISRFGRPWPPFDFMSGMGLVDVDVDEAERLGVITPGESPPPPDRRGFNDGLQASLPDATPEALAQLRRSFGSDIAADPTGQITWEGNRLVQLYDKAVARSSFTSADVHDLGEASPAAVQAAQRDLGIDLTGYTMEVRGQELRHAIGTHGEPGIIPGRAGERHADQSPIGREDVRAIVAVWRSPDRLAWGRSVAQLQDVIPAGWEFGALQLSADIGGELYVGEYIADTRARLLRFGSMWRKNK